MTADIHLLAGAYALGAVNPDEADEFEAHLAGCAACRQEVAEFADTASVLAHAVAEPVSSDLLDRVMDEVRRTPQLPPLERSTTSDRPSVRHDGVLVASAAAPAHAEVGPAPISLDARRRPATTWLLAAAAAVIVVLIGAGTLLLSGGSGGLPEDVAQVVGAPGARSYTMRDPAGGEATVHVTADGSRAAVVAERLPALDASKAYELWFIAGDTPHKAAVFQADGDGNARVTFTPPVGDADTFAVTVEPAGGSDKPTSDPTMAVPA